MRAALGAALLVSALAAVLLLAPMPADLESTAPRLFEEIENLAHPLVFGLLAHLWFRATGRHTIAALFLLLAGAASEWLQMHLGGRDPSWRDVGGDALGIAFALCWHWPNRNLALRAVLWILPLLAALPLAWTALGYAHRAWQAPVLWRADRGLLPDFSSFGAGEYPGLSVNEPLPDWRGHSRLLVTVRNPHPRTIHVKLRVNDRVHNERYEDRYNEEFELPAGSTTTLSVPLARIESSPLGRRMNLGQIRDLLVFQLAAWDEPAPQVTEIRLSD